MKNRRFSLRYEISYDKFSEKQILKRNRFSVQVLWRHLSYQERNAEFHRSRSYHLSHVGYDFASVFDISADVHMTTLDQKDINVKRGTARGRSEVTMSESDRNDVMMMTIEFLVRRWVIISVKSETFAFAEHCVIRTIRDRCEKCRCWIVWRSLTNGSSDELRAVYFCRDRVFRNHEWIQLRVSRIIVRTFLFNTEISRSRTSGQLSWLSFFFPFIGLHDGRDLKRQKKRYWVDSLTTQTSCTISMIFEIRLMKSSAYRYAVFSIK